MDGRNLTWVGVATWAVVALLTIGWPIHAVPIVWGVCMVVFVVAFFVATYDECAPLPRLVLAALQTLAALIAIFVLRRSLHVEPVLLVIVAAELGPLTFLPSLLWMVTQSAALFWIMGPGPNRIEIVLSFLAFEVFAYFAVQIAHREAHARQELAQANTELKVTSGLLDLSSRTEERLRIARDLHDLVGHHLTALSLNLEVASHLADGEAKTSVEKSKAIAKKLLADVREVVSRLRVDEPVDLAAAVRELRDVIASPSLHVDVGRLAIRDSAAAQIALRAVQEIVTNAVRHSGARNLWIRLVSSDHTLEIAARDDGNGTDEVRIGNGLRGIRERVEQVNGAFEVSSARGKGFCVRVQLPIGA